MGSGVGEIRDQILALPLGSCATSGKSFQPPETTLQNENDYYNRLIGLVIFK